MIFSRRACEVFRRNGGRYLCRLSFLLMRPVQHQPLPPIHGTFLLLYGLGRLLGRSRRSLLCRPVLYLRHPRCLPFAFRFRPPFFWAIHLTAFFGREPEQVVERKHRFLLYVQHWLRCGLRIESIEQRSCEPILRGLSGRSCLRCRCSGFRNRLFQPVVGRAHRAIGRPFRFLHGLRLLRRGRNVCRCPPCSGFHNRRFGYFRPDTLYDGFPTHLRCIGLLLLRSCGRDRLYGGFGVSVHFRRGRIVFHKPPLPLLLPRAELRPILPGRLPCFLRRQWGQGFVRHGGTLGLYGRFVPYFLRFGILYGDHLSRFGVEPVAVGGGLRNGIPFFHPPVKVAPLLFGRVPERPWLLIERCGFLHSAGLIPFRFLPQVGKHFLQYLSGSARAAAPSCFGKRNGGCRLPEFCGLSGRVRRSRNVRKERRLRG